MLKLAFVSIFLLGYSLSSPLPQVEDVVDEGRLKLQCCLLTKIALDIDSGSKAIFSLFSQLAGVVQKTGDVISKLSENYTDVPELTQAGEKVTI
jgi:hypothetical protein